MILSYFFKNARENQPANCPGNPEHNLQICMKKGRSPEKIERPLACNHIHAWNL